MLPLWKMTTADQVSLFARLFVFRLFWMDTFKQDRSPAEHRTASRQLELERQLDSIMSFCLGAMTEQGRRALAKDLISMAVHDEKGKEKWMPTLLELLPELDYCRRRLAINETRMLIRKRIMVPLKAESMYQLQKMFLDVITNIPANLVKGDEGKIVHWPSINSLNEYWRWGYLRLDAMDRVLFLVNHLLEERKLKRLPEIPQVPSEFRNRPPGGLGRRTSNVRAASGERRKSVRDKSSTRKSSKVRVF